MLEMFLLWFCDKTCPLEEVQWLFGCWVPAECTVLWPSSGLISLIFDENFQNSQDDLIMWDHFIWKLFLPFLLKDHLRQFLKYVYAPNTLAIWNKSERLEKIFEADSFDPLVWFCVLQWCTMFVGKNTTTLSQETTFCRQNFRQHIHQTHCTPDTVNQNCFKFTVSTELLSEKCHLLKMKHTWVPLTLTN